MNSLDCFGGMCICIFVFFAVCSPSSQTLTMVRFAWSLTCSDTFKLSEDAPQNRLQNGWAVVELSEFVIGVFCLMLTICSVTYYCPFFMILGSFEYVHTLWKCSTKLFTKRLGHCGGKWICISCFLPYAHHLLSHLLWSILHDVGLVLIPSHSMKTLHKTVYKTVELLWR